MNYKYFSEIYTGNTQFEREKMQFFFDKSFREKDETLLRNQYIALRQLEFRESLTFIPECVELSSLAESITVACDILATSSDVSFIFCGREPCYVVGNKKMITKALLNLLSNSYLYGKEKLITVTTENCGIFSKIEVTNGGFFSKEIRYGKGLSYVREVCEKSGGKFFMEQTLTQTKAIMFFKKAVKSENTYPGESFYSLINDRLSPVCIEMFGMEYH